MYVLSLHGTFGLNANPLNTDLAHRISSPSPSREFLERMRRLESDSNLAQEVRMLLGESVQRYSLSHAASEAEAYQMRIRHLVVKEQILDTLSTDAGSANQFLMGIGRQYEGTDLHALAKTMLGMREKVIMLERALGVEGEKMTPEEMQNKVAEWGAKEWDWDNYVTAAGKKSSEAREVKRGEDAERQVDRDATDHTGGKPSAALIPISNPATPKLPPSQSDIEVKEGRNKQQAKLKKAIDANRLLQAKLRQVSDNRNRWSEYCEHLQKKLETSNALLKEHQVAKELVKTAEPEEGGPSRPQTVEREEAVIDVVTPEPEHSEVPPAVLPVSKEAMGPAGRAERGSLTQQTVERDAVPDGVKPVAPHEGVPPALTPQEFHSLYQPKPKTTHKSRPPIATLPPNARIWRDDENGLLPPLLVETYGQRSAYWSGIGSGDTRERGPIYFKDHPMARGGLTIADCSKDALELLEKIKPGEEFVVDDKMRKALRNYKLPASGDPLAALHALAATQENNIQDNPSNIPGDDSSAEQEPETSAFINKLAVFRAQRGRPFQHHKPRIGSNQVDLEALYMTVTAAGGFDQVTQERLGWLKMASRLGFTDDNSSDMANRLKICYWKFLAAWEIRDMHGKEPPPKQMLEDSSYKGLARLARALTGASENANPDSDVETMKQDMDMVELGLNSPAPGTPQPAMISQSAIPTETASAAPSPKLPKLLHTTTVPDSLASSSSVSQHHTSSTQAEHPTSGADTINAEEANQANAAAARPPPSDDEPPVVVSERNVRRRKHNESPPKKKIKQERIQSSPIALFGLRHLQTQESMDLDDIGPKTATPKKRREKQSATGASGLSEEYAPAQVYPQAPTFTSGRDDDNEDQDAPDTPLPPKPSPGTPTVPPNAASILKPRSTNTILPRTSAKTYSAKRRRISNKGADLFSEDGENHLRDADSEEATAETPSKVLPRAVAGRLAGLLEKPSPRRWQVMNMDDEPDSASDSNTADQPTKAPTIKSTIAPRQTVHERLAAQHVEARESMNKPKQRDYESDNDMPDLKELAKAKQMKRIGDKAPETPVPAPKINATARSINARNRVREDVPTTARPEEEPLATRPVSRLSLDDFRINPDYNNGLDYAYRDVVRGREKRKCLAGCTDPSCCGKGFRALAEIATPIRDNLTPAQREEEDKLLTEFLGRDTARLTKHMGKEERRETLIKAKTRELANKHGKHRHAYERRKSPPGFWRADFPTTQEEAEDREKAKVFESDLVQKRYEEAMRGGGKWIFKDQMGGQPDWIGKE